MAAITKTFIPLATDKSFDDVREQAAQIRAGREDFIVADVANNLRMDDLGNIMFVSDEFGSIRHAPMSEWAESQLSSRIGVPAGYTRKCREAGLGALASANVNQWLSKQKGNTRSDTTDYLVRTFNGVADGILSSSYTQFDCDEVLDVIQSSIDTTRYRVKGSMVTDEKLHVRLVSDDLLKVKGEDLFPMLVINSSDVGWASLTVTFGVWKQVCTNGLCIVKAGGTLFRQRHISITAQEVFATLSENVGLIPGLTAYYEDAISRAASDHVNLADPKVFEQTIAVMRNSASFTDEDAKKVLGIAENTYDLSRWGIANAMTLFAQNYEIDRRMQIERAAGHFVSLAA